MMKMKNRTKEKVIAMLLAMTLVGGLITGCGSASEDTKEYASAPESYNEEYGFDSYNMESAEVSDEAGAMETQSDMAAGDSDAKTDNSSETTIKNNSKQKIIKRYNYNYETEHFDDAYAYLKSQIELYEGYISSSEVSGGGYSSDYRTLYMTARIPAADSEQFVSQLGQLGTIVRQSETAEDVTLQYSDTESRIEALEIEQDRLNALLEQADSLETIIALEDRLTEVRYELESYQSKKKLFDDLISYSTINITLEEVNYTVEIDDGTFFSRVVTGLERSLRDIGSGFVSFVEWFIIHLPYFVVWGLIIFGIVKGVGAIRKKNKAKKIKRLQAKQQMQEETVKDATPAVNVEVSENNTK